MNHIISWNKDNYINEDCISTKKEEQWIFKSKGDIEDGTILFQINKTCLFSGKNCTVSTLFDLDEDEMFKIVVGFIYEMFIFGPKNSQWYGYLCPLIKYYHQYKNENYCLIERRHTEWEKKFHSYYHLWKQQFGWTFLEDDISIVDFKVVSNFIESLVVMIDCWVGPCLLPGGIIPSRTGLNICNSTLITSQDVCTLCGEENCYCEEASWTEDEVEDDISEVDENIEGEKEEEEEEEEHDVAKKDCITIVAGSDTTDGNINSLNSDSTLTIHVIDISELQYSNLFKFNNTEEQPIWLDEDGNPSDWLLHQIDSYSELSDQRLKLKLKNIVLHKLIELKNQNVSKKKETYIILRKALKNCYR